jgi:hypothetical protein
VKDDDKRLLNIVSAEKIEVIQEESVEAPSVIGQSRHLDSQKKTVRTKTSSPLKINH